MGSAASAPLRLASGLVDIAILAGAETLLRRGVGRHVTSPTPRTQLERLLLAGCYFVGTLRVAGRTGGQALLGLRVVDELTGERPGWRGSLLWWALRQPPEVLLLPLSSSSTVNDTTAKLRELQPDVDELRRRHWGDRSTLNDAIMHLYQSRGVDLWRGYRPLLVSGVVAAAYSSTITAGILMRPDRRGIHDRLAGVTVVHG
jgi:uncharacterized RDD family membrane protein YckC